MTTYKLCIINLLLPLSPERCYYNYVRQRWCCHKTHGFQKHMPPVIFNWLVDPVMPCVIYKRIDIIFIQLLSFSFAKRPIFTVIHLTIFSPKSMVLSFTDCPIKVFRKFFQVWFENFLRYRDWKDWGRDLGMIQGSVFSIKIPKEKSKITWG